MALINLCIKITSACHHLPLLRSYLNHARIPWWVINFSSCYYSQEMVAVLSGNTFQFSLTWPFHLLPVLLLCFFLIYLSISCLHSFYSISCVWSPWHWKEKQPPKLPCGCHGFSLSDWRYSNTVSVAMGRELNPSALDFIPVGSIYSNYAVSVWPFIKRNDFDHQHPNLNLRQFHVGWPMKIWPTVTEYIHNQSWLVYHLCNELRNKSLLADIVNWALRHQLQQPF